MKISDPAPRLWLPLHTISSVLAFIRAAMSLRSMRVMKKASYPICVWRREEEEEGCIWVWLRRRRDAYGCGLGGGGMHMGVA